MHIEIVQSKKEISLNLLILIIEQCKLLNSRLVRISQIISYTHSHLKKLTTIKNSFIFMKISSEKLPLEKFIN